MTVRPSGVYSLRVRTQLMNLFTFLHVSALFYVYSLQSTAVIGQFFLYLHILCFTTVLVYLKND